MIAFLLLLLALLIASAMGGAAYLIIRSRLSAWIRVPLSLICSLLSLFITGSVFLYGALSYVATDETPGLFLGSDSDLTKPDYIELSIIQADGLTSLYKLRLEFPKYVSRGDDFTIDLQLSPSALSFSPEDRKATAYGAESLKFWNTQDCTAGKHIGIESCGSFNSNTGDIHYSWTGSAPTAGERSITVIFPALKLPEGWTATAKSNDKPLLSCGLYHPDHCHGNRVVMSAASPRAKHSNIGRDIVERHPPWFRLDLAERSITFPVEVFLGLGVSSLTYQWLSILGIAISGALGSGWILRLIEIIFAKKSERSHQPFRPKGSIARSTPKRSE